MGCKSFWGVQSHFAQLVKVFSNKIIFDHREATPKSTYSLKVKYSLNYELLE
jgi:hypothetical protein